ncbi:pyrroline-5-carboxylate reductase dimerization domain-containing protein [Halomonas sabkhae]|uniref:pyrroline-5-carboxylate reductase family protein n=1 Tax=Halomonas sabkhae TaxID=626223 RepID=UPI0025B3FF03|nr:pyrroline-5-carboxylate reductase dimerization domain-containing protein [Halomonas sabkhae]MDN3524731.1 pyrroline-5-carboxylate reductase dimerization domain-containing protein [Halomonas sabkhae]
MLKDLVVGVIGGQGWVGRSLGLALLEQRLLAPEQLVVSSRSAHTGAYADWPGVRCVQDNRQLADLADVIVLSIRPQDLADIDIPVGDKLVISLLAMASLDAVAGQLGTQRVVRAMPNAAAEIQRGYFPWYASPAISDGDRGIVQALLESCGTAREVSSEDAIDYLTAVSGAGPAYPALLAQAMLSHARQAGLDDDIAREAVMQTLVGGSLLLEQQAAEPGEMVKRLVDYQGTTAEGLRTMIEGGFERVVHEGLQAAYRTARGECPARDGESDHE